MNRKHLSPLAEGHLVQGPDLGDASNVHHYVDQAQPLLRHSERNPARSLRS